MALVRGKLSARHLKGLSSPVRFFVSSTKLFFTSTSLRHAGGLTCALLLLAVCGLSACKSDYPSSAKQRAAGDESAREAKQVRTARVVEMPMGQTVTATGTLAADDQATISVKVP